MAELPSARVLQVEPDRETTDKNGRKITFKELDVLEQYRLALAMGAERSDNSAAMRIAAIACMVLAYDDVPVPKPTTPVMVEAAIGRLGDAGLLALITAVNESVAAPAEETAKGRKAAAKN